MRAPFSRSAKTWMKDFGLGGPFGPRNNVYRHSWIGKMHVDGTIEFVDGSVVKDMDIVMFCTGVSLQSSI
jgi:hypothetical protein